MTLKFAKKLSTLAICYKAIPDLELTLSEGLLPDLPDPTRGIDTSLVITWMFQGVIEFNNLSLATYCTRIDVFIIADFGHKANM